MFKFLKNNEYLLLLVLVILICIPVLFIHLGEKAIYSTDESRLAVNAIEMYKNGLSFITTFDNLPDLWNTKPPLLIWIQSISISIFGINELAVRLPSAIFGLATIIFIFNFLYKKIKNTYCSIVSVLVLITSAGFTETHTTRSGDYDSLLTFFMVLYTLNFFIYITEKKNIYLFGFFLFLTLAALTKGIAAFLMCPGILLFLIISKNFKSIILNKKIYIYSFFCLFTFFSFYFFREKLDNGFIKAVVNNELTTRYFETKRVGIDSTYNAPEYNYYFIELYFRQFSPWLIFIPFLMLTYFSNIDKNIKSLILYLTSVSFCFLAIHSSSYTKLSWYLLPLLPILSILVGIFMSNIINNIEKRILFPIFLFCLFFISYTISINNSFYPKNNNEELSEHRKLLYFLRNNEKNKDLLNNVTIMIYQKWNYFSYQPVLFYKYKLEKNDIIINIKDVDDKNLINNQKVLLYMNDYSNSFFQTFKFREDFKEESIRIGIVN